MGTLVNEGKIFCRHDKYLGGKALEINVRHIFRQLGFKIAFEKNIDSDGVIIPNDDFKMKKTIVLEVKLGKSNYPNRTQLRQLDDYILNYQLRKKPEKKGLEV